MGHPSEERLKILQNYYPNIHIDKNYICDACHQAKQRKIPFFPSNTQTAHAFELLHIDIWGPCFVVSMLGFKYFLTIVNDFTRYTWLFPMHNKSEVKASIISFVAYAENHFSIKVKTIRTDNDIEFFMHDYFASKGIIHQTTCVETLEQNGIVERKHQHILNITRTLLFQSKLPAIFWCFVVQHVFLINCMPTPLLNNATPYEKLHKKLCDISSICVFGCLCYSSTILAHRKKLDNRAVPGVFLGFKSNTKGFLFLNLNNHKIDVLRNVIFYENSFPYHSKLIQSKDSNRFSLPIPQNYGQTHDDFYMHTENIDDTNNPSDNTLEIDTNVEQSETITVSPRRSTHNRRPPV